MNFDEEKMDMSGIFTGKSIEEAKINASREFGVNAGEITFKVINDVKKSLFGKIKEEAKVWAGFNKLKTEPEKTASDTDNTAEIEKNNKKRNEEYCRSYIKKILDVMEINADINIIIEDNVYTIDIDSKGSGAVIGRRGETLDALQYLTSLVVNKFEGEYRRVTIDSCGYRNKREETLIQLANKIGQKTLRTGRSTTLEPMNPYERRIIHSAVAKIDGVSSKSVGEEPYRKVVISSDNPKKNDGRKGGYKKKNGGGPRSLDLKTSFEKDYKKPRPEDNINAGLYGKIEI